MTTLPDKFHDHTVCVLGLGYVGLTLATVLAETGFVVYGIEIRPDVVEGLKEGKPPFFEPGLADRLPRIVETGQLRIHEHIPKDCSANVYIITVGTPLDERRRVRTDIIENVSREVAAALADGDMVIMRSTVKIGTTRQVVLPILNEAGKNFDLAFCPERTLEGRALDELRQLPQIVAGENHNAEIRAAQLFQLVTPTVVRVSDVETAEMIKMVDNTHRDVLFGHANEVARLCDAIGISAAEVIRAGNLGYPRTNLPTPGPVGGPCLEKDPYILAESMENFGLEPELALTARHLNERQPYEVAQQVKEATLKLDGFPEDPVIALLGIAFKGIPATDDLRGTMAQPILNALREHFPTGIFRGYDPVVSLDRIQSFGLEPHETIQSAMTGAHIGLILNNHPDFAKMPIEDVASQMARPGLIYDFWNNFIDAAPHMPLGTGYMALGSHGKAVLPNPGE